MCVETDVEDLRNVCATLMESLDGVEIVCHCADVVPGKVSLDLIRSRLEGLLPPLKLGLQHWLIKMNPSISFASDILPGREIY